MARAFNPLRETRRSPRFGVLVRNWSWILAIALVSSAMVLGEDSGWFPPIGDWPAAITAALRHIPLWGFMLAFILLPALGFPILAFYATVGAMTEGLGEALLISWVCMAANMAVSYLVGYGLARPLCAWAERYGYRIPRVEPPHAGKLVILMRASPLPWLMQSLLLTLGGTRFLPYMVFGLPVQGLIGLGVILLGESIVTGNAKWALIGLSLMLLSYVVLSRIRLRGRSRAEGASDAPSMESA